MYVGDPGTVIDNWTTTSYKGKTFDLSANTTKKCEIKDTASNKDIWMIYLPTSTSGKAVLKIKSMLQKVEN